MKVSIITSCFNRERTIRCCLESVLNQDYADIEYIVVDAASTDGTPAILNQYRHRIAKLISEPDSGIYQGLNKGLRVATGDIIGFVHSDDFLYSNHTVSDIVRGFTTTNADIVYGNGLFVNSQQTDKVVRCWKSGSYSKKKVRFGWLPLHTTVYVTKRFLEDCGYYDETYRIAGDSDWLVRALHDMSPRVTYLNQYFIRMRMGGLSTNSFRQKAKWAEDIRMYKSHGIPPLPALVCKIARKIPQFIRARFQHGDTTTTK